MSDDEVTPTAPGLGDKTPVAPGDDQERRREGQGDPRSRLGEAMMPQGVENLRPGQRLRGALGNVFQLRKTWGAAGSYGSLWTATVVEGPLHDPARDETVAVKVLNQLEHGAAAAEYARSLDRGEHVVRGLDHSRVGDLVAFVAMQYLPGQSLRDLVADDDYQVGRPLDTLELADLLYAFAKALPRLYEQRGPARERSYHGDISPKNMVWHQPYGAERGRFVLVDLGHGHRDGSLATLTPSRARYVTPDMFPTAGQGVAPHPIYNDIHQAAQVILYALTGRHPTSSATAREDLDRLADLIPQNTPPELARLLRDMLTPDPRERAERVPIQKVHKRLRSANLSLFQSPRRRSAKGVLPGGSSLTVSGRLLGVSKKFRQ
ncbi:MAG: hypothetical protein QM621_04070 [Aeromicrobium sp.]|uniref:hypothetical protein n=1 Tax=Aeromicrobium sp. TaxID=1871063 RepID=UPI0039E2F48A